MIPSRVGCAGTRRLAGDRRGTGGVPRPTLRATTRGGAVQGHSCPAAASNVSICKGFECRRPLESKHWNLASGPSLVPSQSGIAADRHRLPNGAKRARHQPVHDRRSTRARELHGRPAKLLDALDPNREQIAAPTTETRFWRPTRAKLVYVPAAVGCIRKETWHPPRISEPLRNSQSRLDDAIDSTGTSAPVGNLVQRDRSPGNPSRRLYK
jgi:hypothetical protein